MSTTLALARAEVSLRAQEFLRGVATGGTASTIIDTNNIQHVDGYWAETVVLATGGTAGNLDKQRRVSDSTAATSTLTMYSAFPAAVVAGDAYELYRRFSPTDVDTALNRALAIGAPDFRERVRSVATAVHDTLQYALPATPDVFGKNVISVEYQSYDQAGQTSWPYQTLSTSLYEVFDDYDTATNRVIKTLQLRFNPDTNKVLRVVYDGALGLVSTGTDRIHLDHPELEWLYTQGAAELWRMDSSRTIDSNNRRASLENLARWEAQADRLRSQLSSHIGRVPLRRTTFRNI